MASAPALLVLEFSSVAAGTQVVDAMVKRAPISMLRAGTVQPGKYLIVVGGHVAEVEECHAEALLRGGDTMLDSVLLAEVHHQVYKAVDGKRRNSDGDALGIVETTTVPAIVRAADRAAKTADVQVVEVRLADGLGGKGILHVTGRLEDVEAAVTAGVAVAAESAAVTSVVIPSQHPELSKQIKQSTQFHR